MYRGVHTVPPLGAVAVVLYNLFMDSMCTLVAVHHLTPEVPQAPPYTTNSLAGWAGSLGPMQLAGAALFVTGIAMEIICEETRARFKSKPENKGRVDDTGLFGLVRHPNYLGYTLWRSGLMLATVS